MHDYSNVTWTIKRNPDGTISQSDAHLAVMMDIRTELQKLNRVLYCPNFTAIPGILRTIRRNTTKPRRRKKL